LRHRFDITRIGRIGPRSGCIKSRWRLSRISLEGAIAVPCSHLLHKQFPARSDRLFISRRRPLRLSEILAERSGNRPEVAYEGEASTESTLAVTFRVSRSKEPGEQDGAPPFSDTPAARVRKLSNIRWVPLLFGSADLKSRANRTAPPPFSDTPAARVRKLSNIRWGDNLVPQACTLCARAFGTELPHSLSSRCDKARNSMC
jgi:hypothetical protein